MGYPELTFFFTIDVFMTSGRVAVVEVGSLAFHLWGVAPHLVIAKKRHGSANSRSIRMMDVVSINKTTGNNNISFLRLFFYSY